MKKTILCTHKGWLLFCPVYFEEGFENDWALAPIPRANMWWLMDAALWTQQQINLVVSLFNPEACGFWAYIVPMKNSKTVTFTTLPQ